MFFAAVIQSRPSLTTTPNATHFRPLPLRGIAPKASRFFCRQSTHDVAGRPPRLGPCTASRPNMTRFDSLESPCRTRAPANPSWRFRIVVSMRSEPVLSRTSLYDRGLYPMRSLRRKPIMRKSSLWWAVRRLLKSWELKSCHSEQEDFGGCGNKSMIKSTGSTIKNWPKTIGDNFVVIT